MSAPPTAFISYSWESEAIKGWVRQLASRLRADGVDVRLDQWDTAPGDQLPAFMEKSIRENQYVLIVCTPHYRERSNSRMGGVGYEGDIMTAEVMTSANQRKFIPILRTDSWAQAAPTWLAGKYYVDLRGDPYSEDAYRDLLTTIHGTRVAAPPLGSRSSSPGLPAARLSSQAATGDSGEPIRVLGVAVDEVTAPRLDGTRGSALYTVPFRLTRPPSSDWAQAFIAAWDRPEQYDTMHRPGIARVLGDRVILAGTTMEEVIEHHRNTIVLAVKRANETVAASAARRLQQEEERRRKLDEHHDTVEQLAKKLKFEDAE